MTNNNEKCCERCKDYDPCYKISCPCHTKAQEEWENKIIPEYSSIAVLDEDAFIGYYVEPAILFITNLLRTERERAVSEHDAKWHPLVKGTMVNMHGFKEGRQQAFAEVREMVEEMRKVPAWHKPNINGDIQTAIYAAYNKALTDLFTKLEEKK